MLDRILARHHHAAFGWRVASVKGRSYTRVSLEELVFYLKCHAVLEPMGHPLHWRNVEYCVAETGEQPDELEITEQDRRDAVRWHELVRPHVAGEGWNRR